MASFRLDRDGNVVAVLTIREQAKVAALVTAPPVEAKPRTFATKAELAAGGGFACQVDPACTRRTRTLERSQVHATAATLQTEGHLPHIIEA